MVGLISNIQRFTIHDGPGIRITIFMQGCPLDCWWCHNPENKSLCKSKNEIFRSQMTPEQLMTEIKKELVFIEESGGGVTFSGGEPLMQYKFLLEMLDLCQKENIHTAIDTSGFIEPEIFSHVVHKPNLFLFDIKLIDPVLHKKYTGISNNIILKNLKTLVENSKKINIRYPLIPGITDTQKNLNDIKTIMKLYNLKIINLLPFHNTAEGKYHKLNIENRMKNIKPHSKEELNEIQTLFLKDGFDASIGG